MTQDVGSGADLRARLLTIARWLVAAFGATARDETDLERLTAEMLRVVDETMQPEFVGLWLRDEPRA